MPTKKTKPRKSAQPDNAGPDRKNAGYTAQAKKNVAGPGPGGPASYNPAAVPFLRPEDLRNVGEFDFSQASTEADLANQENQAQVSADYNIKQNNDTALRNRGAAADNAAGRGIFQSSIKDGQIADIEAQRSQREGLYRSELANVKMNAVNMRQVLKDRATAFLKAMQSQAADNAAAVPTDPSPGPDAPAWQTALYNQDLRGSGLDGSAPQNRGQPRAPQAPKPKSVPFPKHGAFGHY